MDLGHPYADVLPGPRGALLATLVRLEGAVTMRELSRQANVSSSRAAEIIQELINAGLVEQQAAGNAILVSLNRHHLAARGVIALAEIRKQLIENLKTDLQSWSSLSAAWLFGSAARGDGNSLSDIDLLLITTGEVDSEEWTRNTSRLTNHVRKWTGNAIQLVEHTEASFRDLLRAKNSLILAIRNDGIALTANASQVITREGYQWPAGVTDDALLVESKTQKADYTTLKHFSK